MRVGLMIYGSLDTLSGGYLYDRVLVEHLRAVGDEVEIISLPWRNYAHHLLDNFDGALIRRLEGAHLDVLVQDELNHPSLIRVNRRLRGRVRFPIVSIVHHLRSSELRPTWQNAIYRVLEKWYLRSVDAFVFNSRTTQGVVEGLVGENRPSVVATPAGNRLGVTLNADQIRERTNDAGPLRVFFLGNIIPRKGLHTLIDGVARLPSGSWSLTAAGSLRTDPACSRAIKQQIARLGLTDSIDLPGPLAGDALIEHFTASHVLAMPSSYEGFGIAYLEGMAFGLPAIATTAGAAHEIITHGTDGFLMPPGDSTALAGYLQMLAEDRKRLLQMSLAARSRFDRHPTWEQTAETIRTFLRERVRQLAEQDY